MTPEKMRELESPSFFAENDKKRCVSTEKRKDYGKKEENMVSGCNLSSDAPWSEENCNMCLRDDINPVW